MPFHFRVWPAGGVVVALTRTEFVSGAPRLWPPEVILNKLHNVRMCTMALYYAVPELYFIGKYD